MKHTIVAGSALAALALAAPLHAQLVRADVVVRTGPVQGHVVINDRHSTYRPGPVVVRREAPIRVIVVERFRGRDHYRHWQRHGYRQVTVYYRDGRYYDRSFPGTRRVVVYARDGHFYRGWGDHRPSDRRGHPEWDRDGHHDRDRDHARKHDRDHDRDRDGHRDGDRDGGHR